MNVEDDHEDDAVDWLARRWGIPRREAKRMLRGDQGGDPRP